MRLHAWSGRMGNLPIHINGAIYEHAVIVQGYAERMWAATPSFSKVSVLLRLH